MRIICAIALGLFLSFSIGCSASWFSASTKAKFVKPDGTSYEYESSKAQEGMEVIYELDEKGNVKKIHFNVAKSSTQVEAIQAALQQSQATNALLQSLMPMILKAAAMSGGS